MCLVWTMLTQIQKMLRASPTAIIVEVAIPDACVSIIGGKRKTFKNVLLCLYLMGDCIWRSCYWQHEGVATGHLVFLSNALFQFLRCSIVTLSGMQAWKRRSTHSCRDHQVKRVGGRCPSNLWRGNYPLPWFWKLESINSKPLSTIKISKQAGQG